ncbi:MAG: HisA/HisF-related TIM barrel protein [Thermoplasmata archaeon]|nr:HisA/HisF-related TIM barrel protein [Thermoplasmata archaeon]
MLRHGQVVVPGEGAPVVARTRDGAEYEVFDVVDSLMSRFGRIYVVDLDGVEENRPQLDYLQEISRDAELWLDAGARTADEAIDALVTGASRVVLSSATLNGPKELARAWNLSQELTFEIELQDGHVSARADSWRSLTAAALAEEIRATGPNELIVGPRDGTVDWEQVRVIAHQGPTWVGGIFAASESERLTWSGSTGGIFHLGGDLLTTREGSPWSTFSIPSPSARDDET